MKKTLFFVLICILLALCLNDSQKTPQVTVTRQEQLPGKAVDQIIVVHFHRVHQCTCCINVGKWAEETIMLYFPEEYEEGKIVYMDVCIEENQEIARKYNAYGASLYINVIKDGDDNIMDAVEVWSHCFDHDKYVDVFRQMLEDALEG